MAKSYYFAGLLSTVGKIFEKIVNNWLLHDLGECDLYPFALDDLGESGLKPFAPNAPFLYPLKT